MALNRTHPATDVLIAFASRHGATGELARALGDVLTSTALSVDVVPMSEVTSVAPYSACILGSAVYMGDWLPEARAFVKTHHAPIAARPTWLFSSGPIHTPRATDALDVEDLVEATGARDHHLFGGKLDHQNLGRRERVITRLVRVPDGDFRDWEVAVAWATAISHALADLSI